MLLTINQFLGSFSAPGSRYKIRPFLDSNRNEYGICTVNWQIACRYAFDTTPGFFSQMVSTPMLYLQQSNE